VRPDHDEPAETARDLDQPGPITRFGPGAKLVQSPVVEGAVRVGQQAVRLGQIVAIELAEVLQHGAVGTADRDQLDRLRRRAGWQRQRVHGPESVIPRSRL
jgi:hypothetical protein